MRKESQLNLLGKDPNGEKEKYSGHEENHGSLFMESPLKNIFNKLRLKETAVVSSADLANS